MRSFVMLTLGLLALGRVAHAQSAAGKGYVEGVAQSAFGNVTSQSYGAEGGFALLHPEQSGGVAFFAHVGGFLFGALTVRAVARRRPLQPTW